MNKPPHHNTHPHNRLGHNKPHPNKPGAALGDYTTADRRIILLSLLAIPIGLSGAAIAWVLVRLIGLITNLSFYHTWSFAFNSPSHQTAGWTVFIPTIVGGLLIGLMARFGSEQIRGHGIPEAIESILLKHSVIKLRVAIIKPIASALAIGTGGPFGAEGPIIMTGGAFGSLFSQLFKLTAMERKTLMVAGASAGMAGIFGTPIAATLIAVELLLFEWRPRSLLPVAMGAAVADITRIPLLGAGPLFAYHSGSMGFYGLLLCVPVGISAGFLSGLLTWLTYKFEDAFNRLPIHWMWWPAIAGVLIGISAFIDPRALGVGYDVIRDLLAGHMALSAVGVLLVVKSILWAATLGSGTSGGVLAPLLIMGGAMGTLEASILPVGEPTLWALIGMAAVLGGTMRSPFTCIVFAIELTHDIHAALPLFIATFVASACTMLMLKRSVLTEKISRHGNHVTREYSTDSFETLFTTSHMTHHVHTLSDKATLAQAEQFFTDNTTHHLPVIDTNQHLVGLLTRTDMHTLRERNPATVLAHITPAPYAISHPHDTLSRVVDRMAEHNTDCAPVIAPDTHHFLGLVTYHDVLHARAQVLAEEHKRLRKIHFHRARPPVRR